MSTEIDLVSDCSSIMACLPQMHIIQVLALLGRHSHQQRDLRIKLTLEDLFSELDSYDNATAQRIDIQYIEKLFPDVARSRIVSLMSYIGNEENRKAVILRLLLKDCEIEKANGKRRLNGLIQEEEQPRKVFKTDDVSSDEPQSSHNNNTVPNDCDSSNNNYGIKREHNESIFSNSDTIIVNTGECPSSTQDSEPYLNIPKPTHNYFEYKISQPSTSRAVWNYITETYEEATARPVQNVDDVIEMPSVDSTSKDPPAVLDNIEAVDRVSFLYLNREDIRICELKRDTTNTIAQSSLKKEQDQNVPKPTIQQRQTKNADVASNSTIVKKPKAESSNSSEGAVDNRLFYPLMEMFPQACPDYLKQLCVNKSFSEDLLDNITTKLLSEDYPLREGRPVSPEHKIDSDEQFEILKQVLPDADPTYLRLKCDQLADKPEMLKSFISDALEHKNYPTMKEYLRKQQLSAQQKQYTVDFDVAKFLEVIPDPVTYFEKEQHHVSLKDVFDFHFACAFLRNEFSTVHVNTISNIAKRNDSLLKAYQELERSLKSNGLPLLKTKRKSRILSDNCQNIPLLQEMAYVKHKREILEYLEGQKVKDCKEREIAKKYGLMQTCNCCFDDEVLEREITKCENGCIFCKQCVQKSVEVAFGDGKLEFPCLTNCSSHFSLQTVQGAVNPKLFSKVAQKKQMEEVKAAGIEDLEMCPFCDFASIPAETDKIFRCLNPECMKESCRMCKEPSHIPLKCDEVEQDEDVKRRTYIENKMSEALLKKCYMCGKCFIKSDGCNKITCTCGAMQCYVCGQPVNSYQHFNGQGGDKYHLCPLYSDTEALHEQAVLNGAEAAKAEIGIDPKQLKIDPTLDIKKHYSKLKAQAVPLPPGINNFNNIAVGLDAMFAHHHGHHHHYRHHHHRNPARPPRRHRRRVRNLPPVQGNHENY